MAITVWPALLSSTEGNLFSAVALTQISAYSTHINLAVGKLMEAMCTAYAKSGTRSQHVSNKTWHKRSRKAREYVEGKRVSFAKNMLFRWIWKVLLKCGIPSSWRLYYVGSSSKFTELMLCAVISQARKALQEQLRISRNLTEKKMASDSDKEEDLVQDAEVEEENTPSSTFGTLVTDKDNPWSIETKASSTGNANSGESSGTFRL